jgi:hypothetical protein
VALVTKKAASAASLTTLETRNPLAVLFSRFYLRANVMAFTMWFFALLGFYGLTSWLAVLIDGTQGCFVHDERGYEFTAEMAPTEGGYGPGQNALVPRHGDQA